MNQRSQKLAPAGDASIKCECECDRVECGQSFRISVEDYEDVRVYAHRFIVAPMHMRPGETVVSTTRSYLVIEKVRHPSLQ